MALRGTVKGGRPSLKARLLLSHTQLHGTFRNRISTYIQEDLRSAETPGFQSERKDFRGKLVFSATVVYSFGFFFLTIFISFCRIYSHQKDEPENKLPQYVWASNILFR